MNMAAVIERLIMKKKEKENKKKNLNVYSLGLILMNKILILIEL